MSRKVASPILPLFRRLVEDHRLKDLTDQELLGRFLNARDEMAFSALIRRHGSMVLDVCRNILGDEQEAEDAFQVTFLVLAQKAQKIRTRSSVGSWLYGVAYRTAIKARGRLAKRKSHEVRIACRATTITHDFTWREVQQCVHEELSHLSERYRAALVYCYLQGKTQDETALLLGVSKATVKKRLEKGRTLMRYRLMRRGLGPAVVLAISVWPGGKAPAAVSPVLIEATIKAATFVAAGHAATAGALSPKVVALLEGVVQAMFLTKVKMISAVVLAVSLVTGAVGWSYRVGAQTTPPQQTAPPGQTTKEERAGVRRVERSLADELESLRLEMEALRKEVRANRARVEALEAQILVQTDRNRAVNTLKTWGVSESDILPIGKEADRAAKKPKADIDKLKVEGQARVDGMIGEIEYLFDANQHELVWVQADPIADAEAALKTLRTNPNDTQAIQALQRAAQRLKDTASKATEKTEPSKSSKNQ